jgi:voltage-gated potassium channel
MFGRIRGQTSKKTLIRTNLPEQLHFSLDYGKNMNHKMKYKPVSPWRQRMYEVIFEAETPEGKAFDVILLFSIAISVIVVLLESVERLDVQFHRQFIALEWFFTVLFTIEYILRLIAVRRRLRYAFSFYGIVDLLAILPTYISLLLPGSQYLLVIRVLRLLRVFRVLKLGEYLQEADLLVRALYASRYKIIVFLLGVMTLVIIIGSFIYVIEGEENGFTSIPTSIYWAIVTLTTVGYGDISPQTPLGQALASMVMLLGYGMIAVPTGIVTVELSRASNLQVQTAQICPQCGREGHDIDAAYCKYCGRQLPSG